MINAHGYYIPPFEQVHTYSLAMPMQTLYHAHY
jgi:hypothetical protein